MGHRVRRHWGKFESRSPSSTSHQMWIWVDRAISRSKGRKMWARACKAHLDKLQHTPPARQKESTTLASDMKTLKSRLKNTKENRSKLPWAYLTLNLPKRRRRNFLSGGKSKEWRILRVIWRGVEKPWLRKTLVRQICQYNRRWATQWQMKAILEIYI